MTDDRPVILIVDDQPLNLQALADCLATHYQVKVATSGPDALTLAREDPYPEVILLDAMMPEMDGYAVCAALRRDPVTAPIPVIFITARTDPDSEARALAEGAVDFIHKPINPAVVRARVQLHREFAQHRNHLGELVHARTLELAEARDAAECANRAKNAFLNTMSHEMRTPLNHITGMAYLLRKEVDTARGRECLTTIDQAAHQLLDLIKDILDLSRLEAGQVQVTRQKFQLRELIDQVVQDSHGPVTDKGLTLVTQIAPAVPDTLHGDPAHLRQVLGQLLSNAVKFSERGRIALRVRPAAEPGERWSLRFEVEDQGVGMAPQMQSGLFALFSQGDTSLARRHGGTGLGLALSKRLVTLMGGEIDLVSMPGEGTTVGFKIPLA